MPDGFARFPLPPPRGLEAAPSPPPRARAAPAGSAASLQRAAFARAPRTSDAASVCPPQGWAVPQLGRPEPRGRHQWQRPSGSVSCDAPSTHRGVAAAAIRHIVSHLRRGRLVPGRGRRRGGGGAEKKGRLRAEWRLRSRCPSPFQEDRSDSRFHECALLRLHVPKTFLHTEPSDSPIGACSGVDGLRAQTLALARLLSWLARAHPSNPVCPRPSVKCRCPRVAAATEGRQEVHRAAPGSHTRAHAHEA